MTTHGCLKIYNRGVEERHVLLYTSHTAQVDYLMNVVRRAPALQVRTRFPWLFLPGQASSAERPSRVRRRVDKYLEQYAGYDGCDWPPSVAGWLMAAQANYLMPIPRAFIKDLPVWSGIDDPFRLVIDGCQWDLHHGSEARAVRVDPRLIIQDEVLESLKAASHSERGT